MHPRSYLFMPSPSAAQRSRLSAVGRRAPCAAPSGAGSPALPAGMARRSIPGGRGERPPATAQFDGKVVTRSSALTGSESPLSWYCHGIRTCWPHLWAHQQFEPFRIKPLIWSPLTESNRRPSPYHGYSAFCWPASSDPSQSGISSRSDGQDRMVATWWWLGDVTSFKAEGGEVQQCPEQLAGLLSRQTGCSRLPWDLSAAIATRCDLSNASSAFSGAIRPIKAGVLLWAPGWPGCNCSHYAGGVPRWRDRRA
jgi:hypothetical protein